VAVVVVMDETEEVEVGAGVEGGEEGVEESFHEA
jgi:hypothetical protein